MDNSVTRSYVIVALELALLHIANASQIAIVWWIILQLFIYYTSILFDIKKLFVATFVIGLALAQLMILVTALINIK